MAALSLPRTVRARRFAVAAVSLLALAGLACGTATADASQARASSVAPARQVVAAGTGCPQSVTGKAASGPLTAAGVSPASWTPAGVPWRSVGRGWILAELAASASASGPQALYLVSPGGQRYRLGTVPAGALLEDWSGNGTDALLLDRKVNSTEESAIVLNLRTGKAGGFALPSGTPYPQISFTRPAGTAVLFLGTASTSGGYLPLQRFSLTGTRQLCYPAQFPRAGSEDGTYRESANGTEIVFATQNGFEVVSNAGQPVRYLAAGNRGYCFLLNWWNSQSVVANCGGGLWTYPLSGAQPRQLTTSKDHGSFLGAWQLPSGTYAEGVACGSTWLEKLNPNGTATHLTIPGAADAGYVQPLGAYGDQLPVMVGGGCDAGTGVQPYSFVDWYSPGTDAATTVIGGRAGGGYVTAAVLNPAS
jgi:hypothetical protein